MAKSVSDQGDRGHFQALELHANGTKRLTNYDFLLVFHSDLRSRWNQCWVISHEPSKSVDYILQEQKNVDEKYPMTCLHYETHWGLVSPSSDNFNHHSAAAAHWNEPAFAKLWKVTDCKTEVTFKSHAQSTNVNELQHFSFKKRRKLLQSSLDPSQTPAKAERVG